MRSILTALVLLMVPSFCFAAMEDGQIKIDGEERRYQVFTPPAFQDIEHLPLYIVLHGGRGRAEKIAKKTLFNEWAQRNGFIVVYPQAKGRAWNAGMCCHNMAGRKGVQSPDDVKFIEAIIDEAMSSYQIDPRRVYIVGHSNGGMMAYRAGCEISDKIRGIAVVSGTIKVQACSPSSAIDVVIIHAKDDLHVPYEGGTPLKGIRKLYSSEPDMSVKTAFELWAKASKCAHIDVDGDRMSCEGHGRVGLWSLPSGGHQLFLERDDRTIYPVGVEEDGLPLNVTGDIVRFFNGHF